MKPWNHILTCVVLLASIGGFTACSGCGDSSSYVIDNSVSSVVENSSEGQTSESGSDSVGENVASDDAQSDNIGTSDAVVLRNEYYFEAEHAYSNGWGENVNGNFVGFVKDENTAGARGNTVVRGLNENADKGYYFQYVFTLAGAQSGDLYFVLGTTECNIDASFPIAVNGEKITTDCAMLTGDWEDYQEYYICNIPLQEGKNVIRINVYDLCYVNFDAIKLVTSGTVTASLGDFADGVDVPYSVSFVVDGAEYATEISNANGVALPTEPSKKGYQFNGWYFDQDVWQQELTSTTKPTANRRVYAKMDLIPYTITYNDTKGATNGNPATYNILSGDIVLSALPSVTGYSFTGWSIASIPAGSTGNVTVTANWKSTIVIQESVQRFGIDISNYQASLNFDQVKGSTSFMILRAGYTGYGGTGESKVKDASFEGFYSKAKARGIPVGAYWYSCANTAAKGRAEAEYMYNNCLKGKQFEYPIYMDVEEPRWQYNNPSGVTAAVKAFCSYLEEKGYYVGIYASTSFFTTHLYADQLTNYDFWIASYATTAEKLAGDIPTKRSFSYNFGMWQYTSNCKISGIGSGVDANVAYKDYPAIIKSLGLNGFTAGSGDTTTQPETPKKSNEEIAQEVLDGLWGDGDERKRRLTEAGYDPAVIQAIVNQLLA